MVLHDAHSSPVQAANDGPANRRTKRCRVNAGLTPDGGADGVRDFAVELLAPQRLHGLRNAARGQGVGGDYDFLNFVPVPLLTDRSFERG